jgi:prophage maintenance system killer protein
VFLSLNGYNLSRDEDRLYDAMIAIGTHRLDKAGLANVFRECSAPEEEF